MLYILRKENNMVVKINSYVIQGLDSIPITVEVSVVKGLPKFEIIGLADIATKESKERIFKSITGLGYKLPPGNITVNLAPAKIKKRGTLYDLPISIGVILASKQIDCPDQLEKFLIAGELSLDGKVREVSGLFITALQNIEKKKEMYYILPNSNLKDLQPFPTIQDKILPVSDLKESLQQLENPKPVPYSKPQVVKETKSVNDFDEVLGNEMAKLALQLAVIQKLNVLFIGPPGGGKSMLMTRINDILPPLSKEESLMVTRIHQCKGISPDENNLIIENPPFREVHNSILSSSLIGGGKYPEPGEISLAHKGFLFLDELSEYGKQSLQSLRLPLEQKKITINRIEGQVTFPCDFTLLACTNPCPCGYYGDDVRMCTCSKAMMSRFYTKLSGPILDRFDIMLFINPFDKKSFTQKKILDSKTMKSNIITAMERKKSNPYLYEKKNIKEIFEEYPIFQEWILKSLERKLFSLRKVKSILKTCYSLELFYGEKLNSDILLTAIDLCRNKILLD